MSLTVKAYLYRNAKNIGEGKEPEIRRFGVDEGVATNYSYLEKRMMHIFPNLVGHSLRMFWKDAENDFISFSTDDELLDAVSTIHDSVFKIYVTSHDGMPKTDQADSSQFTDEPVHPHITCDVCQGPIRGLRYKCVECPDYDLCKGCENAGKHGEHAMLRVVKPTRLGPGHMPFMFGMGPFGGGRCPFGSGRGRFFPRPHSGHHHRQHHGHHHHRRGEEAQNSSAEEQSSAETGENQQQTQFDSEEFLWRVGENVAAFLDPLGIDCQIDVEQNGRRMRCGQERREEPTSMDTEMTSTNTATSATKAGPSVFDTNVPAPPVPTPQESQDSTEPKVTEGDSIGPQNTTNAGVQPPSIQEHSNEARSCSWTPLQPSLYPNPHTTVYQPVRQMMGPDPYERGLAPHIIHALNQMKSMGFNNDGGWLSALLATKNGDIDSTLESLKPNFTNSAGPNGLNTGNVEQ